MKILQDKPEFSDIHIILRTAREATAFISIMDGVDLGKLNAKERLLVIEICNVFSNRITY